MNGTISALKYDAELGEMVACGAAEAFQFRTEIAGNGEILSTRFWRSEADAEAYLCEAGVRSVRYHTLLQ